MSKLSRSPVAAPITVLDAAPGGAAFLETYCDPEQPLIVKGLAKDWPARRKWTAAWLRETLHKHPKVKDRGVFFISRQPVLVEDIVMPEFLKGILTSDDVMPDSIAWRFWANSRNNRTEFHYDTNAENVITVQVKGRKEWVLVSPETPLPSYPFTNFTLLKDEDSLLRGKHFHKFVLEEGDLLYVPPIWYHRAVALEEENLNINWTFTKKMTWVVSREFRRDVERCNLLDGFKTHRSALVRGGYSKVIRALPKVGGIGWGLKTFIASPYSPGRGALAGRFARELLRVPGALTTLPRVRRTLKRVDKTT